MASVLMIRILKNISEKNRMFLGQKGLSERDGLVYFREKLYLETIVPIIILSLMAYAASVISAFTDRIWTGLIVDSVALFVVIGIYILKEVNTKYKLIVLLIVFYLLGVISIVNLGPLGSGFIWLVGFSVLTTVLIGLREGILAILIVFLTLLFFGLSIYFQWFETLAINKYTVVRWASISIDIIMICLLAALISAYFINSLIKALVNEEELRSQLKKKSKRLIHAKIKAEESDQLKSAFLANIGHEFRTPMNSIIGFTEIMLYTNPDEARRTRYLTNIQKSGEQLLQIIQNTIEYSRIEMGTMEFDPTCFDVLELLNIIYEQKKPDCPEGVDFILEENQSITESKIYTDKKRLIQIISNLISNAFKFTEKGKVSFGIIESPHKGFLRFYVTDTGIGIRKEKQKDIFNRFHKEDEFMHGTGLSLSISATLIVHMGGRIWLDSESGKGTNFYFNLPVSLDKERLAKTKTIEEE